MKRLQILQHQIAEQKEFIYSLPTGTAKQGQTRIYRHPNYVNGLMQIPNNIKNLADFWDIIVKKYSQNKALEDLTYNEVDKLAKSLGSWLLDNKHHKIFLYATNSINWTITDVASWNYDITNVPLYDTLGEQAFFHIINLTQGTAIFTTNDLSNNLFKNFNKEKANINTIVYLDKPSEQNKKKLQSMGFKVFFINDLYKHQTKSRPSANLQSHITYSFTSGTTGLPKGVIGTHQSVISQCLAMIGFFQFHQNDVHLSFLPIAHSFQRFMSWCILNKGANIRYSQFPIAEIVKDFARAKPTTIPMVPRLLNKLYPVCKGIFDKEKNNAKIKGVFGGRIRLMATGSAPISPQVLSFFKQTLQCDVRQGYGQTQTTAASFVTRPGDTNYGHVGGPNAVTQFKLIDVPQMNYFTNTNPPKGQILTRGKSVFKGYYLDEKNTKQTIDQQGWNHSGDIGVILPNGSLKIIDRKKNIYKLSQGQYIAPQKIENIYLRCTYVAECFLYGDSLQNFNVAVIHPHVDIVINLAKKLNISSTDIKQLCSNKQIQEFILKEMTEHGKKQGLNGLELAKKVKLNPVSFGNLGIFTSTMKLQRHIAKEQFKKYIEIMYKEK